MNFARAKRSQGAAAQVLVIFNTADEAAPLNRLALPPGARLQGLFGIDGQPSDLRISAEGHLSLQLPARSGQVWGLRPPVGAAPHAAGARRGAPAPAATPQAESPAAATRTQASWTTLADVADPPGDDRGPGGVEGRYVYPTDASYAGRPTMDLRRIEISAASDGALRFDLSMGATSRVWNPPNGFDHVAFTLFIELPGAPAGQASSDVMPLENTALPASMRWHYRLRMHGWSNALFSAEGASASHEGRPHAPAAAIEVDRERQRIRFTLRAAALGRPASLSGAKIYLSTWDYDGGFRPLSAQAQPWAIGGGNPVSGAKVMDDSGVIDLP